MHLTLEFEQPSYIDVINQALKNWKYRATVRENIWHQMEMTLPDNLTSSEIRETVEFLEKAINASVTISFSRYQDRSCIYISCSYDAWP